LELEHCSFPDNLLYDLEGNTWITNDESEEATVGMTSLLSAIAGKFTSARIRPAGTRVKRGRSLGTLESLKFVGPIPSPVSGIISLVNVDVVKRPKKIAEFHARCFKAFPDHEMYEIGTECSAVLVRLNELLATIPIGDVVHLVTDDPTSYVEMVRWMDQTGHELVDWRQEGNLFHFIVRKGH